MQNTFEAEFSDRMPFLASTTVIGCGTLGYRLR